MLFAAGVAAAYAQTPVVSPGGVIVAPNSTTTPLAPGSLVAIYGTTWLADWRKPIPSRSRPRWAT